MKDRSAPFRSPSEWRPAASLEALRLRAGLLAQVRAFFSARGVLEVETPLLAPATASDVHIASIPVPEAGTAAHGYLQPSPEFHMKRLLAAGSGPIYQLGRAFRAQERGRHHNPEFTLLEWYRPGYDHHGLMAEVEALLDAVLGSGRAQRVSYREAFRRHADIDPHTAPTAALREYAARLGAGESAGLDRDGCLDLILSRVVQPALGAGPVFVHDFPASQASLARVEGGYAQRFEVFAGGIELANGYRELTDPAEQRRRFEADRRRRRQRGLPDVAPDERLLAALEHGLPEGAGVALGFDRLVMLAAGASELAAVMAFPAERA